MSPFAGITRGFARFSIAGEKAAFGRGQRLAAHRPSSRCCPFFPFKGWFNFVDPVFTWLGLLDAVGNVVMLALWWGGGGRGRSMWSAHGRQSFPQLD